MAQVPSGAVNTQSLESLLLAHNRGRPSLRIKEGRHLFFRMAACRLHSDRSKRRLLIRVTGFTAAVGKQGTPLLQAQFDPCY
eukprot:489505-Hanusia_phi.AAC.1